MFQFFGRTSNGNDGAVPFMLGEGNANDVIVSFFIWSVMGMM
jgi:hypothetical protein